jgi:ribosomal subunit interface protein
MRIQVSGKQMDVGEALRGHVEERFAAAIGKYSINATDCVVIFARDAHETVCEASVHLSTGMRATAKARAKDPYAAGDLACDRLEKQLRRYKRRLKDHHKARSRKPIPALEASSYVLQAQPEEAEEPETLQPVVIAELKHRIQAMTVGEAVMQMEMADETFLIFKNESHGGINVVFRRPDGNIGWVDPVAREQG